MSKTILRVLSIFHFQQFFDHFSSNLLEDGCPQGFFFATFAIFDNLLIISLQICVDLCSRMDVRKGLILDEVH